MNNDDPSKLKQIDPVAGEEFDIESLHAAAFREKPDPKDGNEPLSLWMVCLFGVILFVSGLYLALYSGGFRWDSYSIYDGGLVQQNGATDGAAAEEKPESLVDIGKRVYSQNCVACHQGTGMGSAGVFPPLAGSHWVTGSEKRVAAIILHGLMGPVDVEGTTYNGAMPAWDKNLNDEKIAAVLTYIRQEWGNQAGEINPQQIANARKEFEARTTPWSEAELLAIPEDAGLEGGTAQ